MTNNIITFFNVFALKVLCISKSFLKTLNWQHFRKRTMEEGNILDRNTEAQIAYQMKNIT